FQQTSLLRYLFQNFKTCHGQPQQVGRIGEQGRQSGQFQFPQGHDVGPDGALYVVDSENHRIQKFAPGADNRSYEPILAWGGRGHGAGKFLSPVGISVDKTYNTVFVTDTGNDRIEVFDHHGNFITEWGGWRGDGEEKLFGNGTAYYIAPVIGVKADGHGNVFVPFQGSIQKFVIHDQPPAVSIDSLPSETPIQLPVQVRIEASDDWGVTQLILSVNGVVTNTKTIDYERELETSFEVTLNTIGQAEISVKAIDAANHDATASQMIQAIDPDRPYTLTTQVEGEGNIEKSPDHPEYPAGSLVIFRAVPSAGWQFNHWEGALSGNENPQTLTITEHLSVTAVFSEIPRITHTITASAGPGGSIEPSGSMTVTEGEGQTFAIIANAAHEISDVLVDNVSQGVVSSYTFQDITADHTIEARFSENPTDCRNHDYPDQYCTSRVTTACRISTCNQTTGVCKEPTASNETACNDGNTCTSQDVCRNGVCMGAEVANNTTCSNNNACDGTETCQNGACTTTPNTTPNCDDRVACTVDTCDSTQGCQHDDSSCGGGTPRGGDENDNDNDNDDNTNNNLPIIGGGGAYFIPQLGGSQGTDAFSESLSIGSIEDNIGSSGEGGIPGAFIGTPSAPELPTPEGSSSSRLLSPQEMNQLLGFGKDLAVQATVSKEEAKMPSIEKKEKPKQNYENQPFFYLKKLWGFGPFAIYQSILTNTQYQDGFALPVDRWEISALPRLSFYIPKRGLLFHLRIPGGDKQASGRTSIFVKAISLGGSSMMQDYVSVPIRSADSQEQIKSS
ncbi:MAG: NHL repeat-containing protein, partial [Candidatus Omnitrophica bacterium]|nr:NHL repeat-containing protein [Candidatus Omnitrophota bacterium]